MIDFSSNYHYLKKTPIEPWVDFFQTANNTVFTDQRWGDLPGWLNALDQFPEIQTSHLQLDQSIVAIGNAQEVNEDQRRHILGLLKHFFPWRKGPFSLFGNTIDTEWRSDWKWDRLKQAVGSLEGQHVLDVGCGSGYHCWRMKGAGAQTVMGIDPTMLYPIQFQIFQKYAQDPSIMVFPLGIDAMPQEMSVFDTVFSMGLLYHRRSPLDHLLHLKALLKPGSRLFLETLVIEGQNGDCLCPSGRYAKMPNVWFIPSCGTLESWLNRTGFKKIDHIDTTVTTTEEQRTTEWLESHSLEQFLDPTDPTRTCEGYPAPQRAIFCASL